uniref:Uncharacterized protein n=1 Tax=Nelumbo nucifera TaxID=4432 RepID=A0A822YAX7_NELNU|nr:TPA_asm: hypothetical protein HUJ06_028176 [Nelumbo nucifera]
MASPNFLRDPKMQNKRSNRLVWCKAKIKLKSTSVKFAAPLQREFIEFLESTVANFYGL